MSLFTELKNACELDPNHVQNDNNIPFLGMLSEVELAEFLGTLRIQCKKSLVVWRITAQVTV